VQRVRERFVAADPQLDLQKLPWRSQACDRIVSVNAASPGDFVNVTRLRRFS